MSAAKVFIKNMYFQKKTRNSSYSLRAFARDWGIQAGRASEILSGKRNITLSLGYLFIKNFKLENEKGKEFLSLIKQENESRKTKLPVKKLLSNKDFLQINHWQYYALLSLIEHNPLSKEPNWYAQKLGITNDEIIYMINKFLELKILIQHPHGYELTAISTTTQQDHLNLAIQQFHNELCRHHLKNIKELPPQQREVQSVILSVNPKKLDKAKKMIRQFVTKFEKECFFHTDPEIYALSILLSPLTIMSQKD